MYCINCGAKHGAGARYCDKCGVAVGGTKDEKVQVTRPIPQQGHAGLVVLGYLALILQLNIFGIAVSIIAGLTGLIVALVLLSVNMTFWDKKQGKIILAVWLMTNTIAFVVALNFH